MLPVVVTSQLDNRSLFNLGCKRARLAVPQPISLTIFPPAAISALTAPLLCSRRGVLLVMQLRCMRRIHLSCVDTARHARTTLT